MELEVVIHCAPLQWYDVPRNHSAGYADKLVYVIHKVLLIPSWQWMITLTQRKLEWLVKDFASDKPIFKMINNVYHSNLDDAIILGRPPKQSLKRVSSPHVLPNIHNPIMAHPVTSMLMANHVPLQYVAVTPMEVSLEACVLVGSRK